MSWYRGKKNNKTNNPQTNLISKFLTYVSTQKINSTVIGKGKEGKKKFHQYTKPKKINNL